MSAPLPTGSPQAAISNHIVHVMSEFTGRGPTQARTTISEDLVTVVLEHGLTKGERRLVEFGSGTQVRAMRHAFQQAMGADMIAGVEQITGRTVLAFLSANHLDPDIAIENFVLQRRA